MGIVKASVLLRKLDEAAHEDGAILAHFHLMDALPLIADVVEAAERDEYLEDVDIPEVIDHYTPLSVTITRSVKEWKRLKSDRAALTALRDALQPEAGSPPPPEGATAP